MVGHSQQVSRVFLDKQLCPELKGPDTSLILTEDWIWTMIYRKDDDSKELVKYAAFLPLAFFPLASSCSWREA